MSPRRCGRAARARRLAAAVGLAAALAAVAPVAGAADTPCDGLSELACGFGVPEVAVSRVPAIFKLQARIAPGKLPLGDTTLQQVLVHVLAPAPGGGQQILCAETLTGVEVRGNVVNLTIGQAMSCELDEVLAAYDDVSFQLCPGGPSGCLAPVTLASTAYATKVTYARTAGQAHHAHLAGRATYAHRATADRDHFLRDELGAGYFDFYTHVAADAAALYDAEAYAPHAADGFLQWTPIRSTVHRSLHLAAREHDSKVIGALAHLALAALETRVHGDLRVESGDGGDGLTVDGAGAQITGASDVDGALDVGGAVSVTGAATIGGSAAVAGEATVDGALTVLAGGLHVSGDLEVLEASLEVSGDLTAAGSLGATGALAVSGALAAATASLTGGLTVVGAASLSSIATAELTAGGTVSATSAAIAGDAGVAGDLSVAGGLEVADQTALAGAVVFEGGYTAPPWVADKRYVLADGETRDLTFGGAIQLAGGLTLGDDLDLQGHQLLGARLPVATEPPAPCGATTEGLWYVDPAAQAVRVCVGGEYLDVHHQACGNGRVEPHEQCDDGGAEAGDGCDDACRLEGAPWQCTGPGVQPTVCTVCGDGVAVAAVGEACDDGGLEPGDGCDAACAVEPSWQCWGEASKCYQSGSLAVEYEAGPTCVWDREQVLPAGLQKVTIEAWGASGAHCEYYGTLGGGRGGYVKAELDLSAEDGEAVTLWLRVGAHGEDGGCPGGGGGANPGGGYTSVGLTSDAPFLVAGGGGGCAESHGFATVQGGAGGYPFGGHGLTAAVCGYGLGAFTGGGAGGNQTTGGPGGQFNEWEQCSGDAPTVAGAAWQGGSPGPTDACGGLPAEHGAGGGGGGYFGGGAGAVRDSDCAGAGGGGSSWFDPEVVSGFSYLNNTNAYAGKVVLTW